MFVFELANGKTGEITVIEDLLDTEERAAQRAEAEFLENSYTIATCSFDTYITNFNLGQIISVRGLSYKIMSLSHTADEKKIVTHVEGERYEN